MSDLIDREHVIDFLKLTRDSEHEKSMSAEVKHKSVIRSKHDAHVAFCDYLIEYVNQVPTRPTPSNTLGTSGCVERQAAIDAFDKRFDSIPMEQTTEILLLRKDLRELPSAFELFGNSEQLQNCKTGKWIYGEHDVSMCDGYRCDKCDFFVPWDYQHKSIDFIKDYNYCPSCGADMEVKND